MSERQGVFPPKLRNGSEHFLRCSGNPVTCVRSGGHWLVPGWALARTSDQMVADGWTYLGPAPTHEQAQADAADARRSLITGAAGGGTTGMPVAVAQRTADDLNREWRSQITHWVEPNDPPGNGLDDIRAAAMDGCAGKEPAP